MAAGDDALGVGHDRAVVQEDVDMVLRGEERGDLALNDEVRLDPALDRLLDPGVGLVQERPDASADRLLPRRQGIDVRVDAGVRLRHAVILGARPAEQRRALRSTGEP
ncbi:MAG TPA: hypothetical protein VJ506_10855 [Candidatus Limnocylindrales bacterium]|nr:hypothetical protein [Candidatus Limnocylindrales bacterium]